MIVIPFYPSTKNIILSQSYLMHTYVIYHFGKDMKNKLKNCRPQQMRTTTATWHYKQVQAFCQNFLGHTAPQHRETETSARYKTDKGRKKQNITWTVINLNHQLKHSV